MCSLATCSAPAQVLEAELKAAFVFNFALFTEWPQDSLQRDPELPLCVAENAALRDAVTRLAGKRVNGRRLGVLVMPANAAQRARCRIWLHDAAREPQALEPAHGVLSISDGGDIVSSGAVIVLVVEGEHVRFDISTRAAQAAGLQLSSKLLRLARKTR